MANRGAKKEHRIQVEDVKQWQDELTFAGLTIVEVYSSWFGPCEAILPTLNAIMLEIDDAETKLKWLQVNVVKLEEQQRAALKAELRKKYEMEMVNKRKSGEVTADETEVNQTENESEIQSKIQGLEKYSGYIHPRPLWLFFKGGQQVDELRSANPPRLRKLIDKHVKGVAVELEPEPDQSQFAELLDSKEGSPAEEESAEEASTEEQQGETKEAEAAVEQTVTSAEGTQPAGEAAAAAPAASESAPVEASGEEKSAEPAAEEAKPAEPATPSPAADAPPSAETPAAAEETPAVEVSEQKPEEAAAPEAAAPAEAAAEPAAEPQADAPAAPAQEQPPQQQEEQAPAAEAGEVQAAPSVTENDKAPAADAADAAPAEGAEAAVNA